MTNAEMPLPGQPQPWGAPSIALPGATPEAAAAVPTPAGGWGEAVEFESDGGGFLKKLVRGGLLELATFGFYRFWLATDIRRHLWSHTHVRGEGAEYTGTGRELLVGFLFALAILVPIYLVYFLIGIEAERMQAFASIPLGLFMLLFSQFAIYRARRYRLTRTVWRGVRFWMTGSGWKYAFISFGWMIAVFFTLGLLYPWRAAALERYKMAHTRYGDLNGDFDAAPSEFFKKGFWLWLAVIAPILLLIGAAVASGGKRPGAGAGVLVGLSIFWLMLTPFLYPFFKALEWRWWASGISFGGARMHCDLRGGQLLGLFFKYLVIVSIVSGAVSALVFGVGAVVLEVMGLSMQDLASGNFKNVMTGNRLYVLIGAMAVGYLFVAMAAGVVQRYFLQHEYWAMIAGSLTLTQLDGLENVQGRGELAGALGEGLADGLDVAGF
jgi:uncharacterized membrane protein YjgN (DUF898 family)